MHYLRRIASIHVPWSRSLGILDRCDVASKQQALSRTILFVHAIAGRTKSLEKHMHKQQKKNVFKILGVRIKFGRIFLEFYAFITEHHSLGGEDLNP